MVKDRYSAVWVSHTSLTDFLRCPRAYYLKNLYRDKITGHKIKITAPPLSLGQAVHEVIEVISQKPVEERFKESLVARLDQVWKTVAGKRGGFTDAASEQQYKHRAQAMLLRLMKQPGPLAHLTVKINRDLPYYWLSEKDNIILCGKIDWLEYLETTDSVGVIDFKTGRHQEEADSQQLAIYYLLVSHCQRRPVSRVSYWYLEKDIGPQEQPLPEVDRTTAALIETAKKIKLARQLSRFKCPHENGCSYCRPYETILQGRAQLVGQNSFHEDLYILDQPAVEPNKAVIH
ncbi:PD-(D/E)XK nuclease family protein [Patescibacteria group bacterium]|nr:PD-(D/E)XK nuclease family protein [Patescibacteria group bacterium]MCL5091711.1 PD-(D/E)XK nuclease family protein [Patescibacteria group bacterium]